MTEFWRVLGLVAIPAVGAFAGGLLAESLRLSKRTISLAMHWAAGTLLAVIGIKLMPRALEAQPPWPMILIFIGGALFLVVINWLTSIVQTIRQPGRLTGASSEDKSPKGSKESTKEDSAKSQEGGSAGSKAPWVIFIGVAADYLTDGIIIGTGTSISGGLGLLLGLALFAADTPEGFSTIATLKQQRGSRRTRLLLTASFPVILVSGAVIGFFVFRNSPESVKLGVLAFTAGEVLALVLAEIVREAHREWSSRWAVMLVIGGFSLFALLSAYIQ